MAVIPVIEELVQILTQTLEIVKGNQIKKMTLLQNELNDLEETKIKNEDTRVIGFQIPEEDEYIDEEEEDY